MVQLGILGHATRGKEIIKLLEMLGGKNVDNYKGNDASWYYIIRNNEIDWCHECTPKSNFISFTLEEFLEKFPYKVGDKVLAFGNKWTIVGAVWDRSIEEVVYTIKSEASGYTTTKLSNQLQPYKEEAIDKAIKAVFDANVQCCDIMNHLIKEETMEEELDENGKTYAVRKQPEYPKTYEECCDILGITYSFGDCYGYRSDLISFLQELLICRDAYWKIVREQMGLGKLWEPDWEDETEIYYTISYDGVNIKCYNNTDAYSKLAFPTKEIRDKFYANFKELIEECKELL